MVVGAWFSAGRGLTARVGRWRTPLRPVMVLGAATAAPSGLPAREGGKNKRKILISITTIHSNLKIEHPLDLIKIFYLYS